MTDHIETTNLRIEISNLEVAVILGYTGAKAELLKKRYKLVELIYNGENDYE